MIRDIFFPGRKQCTSFSHHFICKMMSTGNAENEVNVENIVLF